MPDHTQDQATRAKAEMFIAITRFFDALTALVELVRPVAEAAAQDAARSRR